MTQKSNWPWPIWPVGLDKIRFMADTSFSVLFIFLSTSIFYSTIKNNFLTHP